MLKTNINTWRTLCLRALGVVVCGVCFVLQCAVVFAIDVSIKDQLTAAQEQAQALIANKYSNQYNACAGTPSEKSACQSGISAAAKQDPEIQVAQKEIARLQALYAQSLNTDNQDLASQISAEQAHQQVLNQEMATLKTAQMASNAAYANHACDKSGVAAGVECPQIIQQRNQIAKDLAVKEAALAASTQKIHTLNQAAAANAQTAQQQATQAAAATKKPIDDKYNAEAKNINARADAAVKKCDDGGKVQKIRNEISTCSKQYAENMKSCVMPDAAESAKCKDEKSAIKAACEQKAKTSWLGSNTLETAEKDMAACAAVANQTRANELELNEKNKAEELKAGVDAKEANNAARIAQEAGKVALDAQAAATGCKFKFQTELVAPFVQPPPNPPAGTPNNWMVRDKAGNCFLWRSVGDSKSTTDSVQVNHWYQVIGADTGNELLTRYARMIYTFLAGVIGIISVLMVIVGGIQVSVGGLNQSAIESGKNRIAAALAGIALLFVSSLILYTINPHFFSF